jgi:4-amino-4-deoxy-L-arabinose transferase-like glycosyltransferase
LTTAAAPVPELYDIPRAIGSTRWPWLAVLLLFAVVYLGSAFSPALQDDADSTHAEAAREMYVTGDYVTLHVNGVRYLEKAPLMYWLIAFGYRVFGVNEFATRLPTVITMFLLVVLAGRWASRAFGAQVGVYASLFVSTAAGYYLFTRIVIPDALLSLLIASSFYFFLTALDDQAHPWRWYAGYASLASAVLTKGLVALVFVGIPAVVYLALTGEGRRWREFHLLSGLSLFLIIAAPWHLLAGFRNPRFFWFYFVNEHFLRFVGKRYPRDYNKVPAVLYWSLHLVWLFPWSLYLPLALRRLGSDFQCANSLRLGKRGQSDFAARTKLICWIWGGVVLTFFAFSTSQEYYTLPAYLPLLLLLATAMVEDPSLETGLAPSPNRKWLLASAAISTLVALCAGSLLIAGLWASRNLPFVSDISTVLAKHSLAQDTLSMSHILDLTSESFAALRLPAAMAAFALIIGPTLALWLLIRGKQSASIWFTALTMAMFLIAAHVALGRFDYCLSSRSLAQEIARDSRPEDEVAIYGDQAFGSSLLFYLKRRIYLVNGKTTSMWFGSTYSDAPKIYLEDSDLLHEWDSARRIFLFVPPHQRARVDSLLSARKFMVGESSGKIIYSNRR